MNTVTIQKSWYYQGRQYEKGDTFDAPSLAFESFLCDQERVATRGAAPKKRGSYKTRQMKAERAPENAPAETVDDADSGDA